jgi:thiamine-phosphate pyrophosphorylase
MIDPTELMTPAVNRALALASRIAAIEQSQSVSAVHVVHAMLADEPEGMAAATLLRHGYPKDGALFELSDAVRQSTAKVEQVCREVSAVLRFWPKVSPQLNGEVLLVLLLHCDSELDDVISTAGVNTDAIRASIPMEMDPIPVVEPLTIVETAEAAGIARIIDSNINRASEAARVLEDYARFALNDAGMSRNCKHIRHKLRELPTQLGVTRLAGRDVVNDVGTAITTPSEYRRADANEVVTANARRLQESLRTLEEYSKTINASVAKSIEAMRYESYVVESALGTIRAGQDRLLDVKLYWLFTGSACRISPERAVHEAVEGGVRMIQLREKSLSDEKLLAHARDMRKWTREAGVLFIVNDRPDIARLVDADGVHLGQDDLPPSAARSILGSKAIIGVSTHNIEQVRSAVCNGANYIGVGPTFPSSTKEFAEFAGLDFVRQVEEETALPAFVLGGVTADNLAQVVAASGRRIAVSAAISTSEYPREAARKLLLQ